MKVQHGPSMMDYPESSTKIFHNQCFMKVLSLAKVGKQKIDFKHGLKLFTYLLDG
jgi:hypothetical protein